MANLTPPPKGHRDRLHDLASVQHGLKTLVRLLRDGYRFDDEDGPRVIEQLEKSEKLLAEEIERLKTEWNSTR